MNAQSTITKLKNAGFILPNVDGAGMQKSEKSGDKRNGRGKSNSLPVMTTTEKTMHNKQTSSDTESTQNSTFVPAMPFSPGDVSAFKGSAQTILVAHKVVDVGGFAVKGAISLGLFAAGCAIYKRLLGAPAT